MKPLDLQQRQVARAMAVALLLSIVILGYAGWLLPSRWQPMAPAQALRWLCLLPLPLLVSIAAMARQRFFSARDLDGGAVGAGSGTVVRLQAIIQNTLEQTVLALVVYLGWVSTAPVDRLGMIPAATLLFVVGRMLFARGYKGGASARALGFALTFYPTVLLCLVALVQWLYPAMG